MSSMYVEIGNQRYAVVSVACTLEEALDLQDVLHRIAVPPMYADGKTLRFGIDVTGLEESEVETKIKQVVDEFEAELRNSKLARTAR